MSLYDDDDMFVPPPSKLAKVAEPPKKEEEFEKPAESPRTTTALKTSTTDSVSMKFLQAQFQQSKRQASQLAQKYSAPPVVDLSNRSKTVPGTTTTISTAPPTFIRTIRATPLTDGVPLSFLPKSATDDSVLLFGEIVVKSEYQPAVPNDYVVQKRKKEEREAREKIAREIADRLAKEHEEEEKKREKGAAIAPPQALIDDSPPPQTENTRPASFTPSFLPPAFTKNATRGLGVAANIMSKYGYKSGSGLGAKEQGMSTALQVERTGKQGGIIIAEGFNSNNTPDQSSGVPQVGQSAQISMTEAMKNSTKVLLLTNIVGTEEVDGELEEEIREEMSKYGQVVNVVTPNPSSEADAVRIFVEYTNAAQAIKAFVVMNGRFFAGRSVVARFYDLDDYNSKEYNK
ncbi:hypothetical protein WR25_23442 [Diploscapter pachys]|uniref:Splicing factor 45 n=1 Tax=Diploscapter pachys TaxID=2018661 RepID=A0A2A2KQB7_9BILA|nr:hypothetical protein WR25_23442 [Diploscapter pachys]